MLLDAFGFIVMEQNGFPGNIGDSAAETGRYITMSKVKIDLSPLVTDKGVLRHPTSPWREDDTSSDQVAPLIAAASIIGANDVADTIIRQIRNGGYKTGNRQLISPGLYANIRRHEDSMLLGLSDLAILGQALLFKFPYRWSDSKKTFESSANSSADYLNFVNALIFAKAKNSFTLTLKLTVLITSGQIVIDKIRSYYASEPNSAWIIKLYEENIKMIYGDVK